MNDEPPMELGIPCLPELFKVRRIDVFHCAEHRDGGRRHFGAYSCQELRKQFTGGVAVVRHAVADPRGGHPRFVFCTQFDFSIAAIRRLRIRRIDQHQDLFASRYRSPQRYGQLVAQAVINLALKSDVVIQIVVLEALRCHAGFGGLHHVDVGLVKRGHVDVARVAVLDFQVAHTAAHVPHDVVLLITLPGAVVADLTDGLPCQVPRVCC